MTNHKEHRPNYGDLIEDLQKFPYGGRTGNPTLDIEDWRCGYLMLTGQLPTVLALGRNVRRRLRRYVERMRRLEMAPSRPFGRLQLDHFAGLRVVGTKRLAGDAVLLFQDLGDFRDAVYNFPVLVRRKPGRRRRAEQ